MKQGSRLIIALVLAIILALGAGCSQQAREVSEPQIVLAGNKPELLLPQSLRSLLKEHYPRLRIASDADFDRDIQEVYREERLLPFACSGDFNGDGLTDVALILVGRGSFKIISFHQTASGSWKPFVFRETSGDSPVLPIGFCLRLVKPGKTRYWEFPEGEEIVIKTMELKHFGIDVYYFGKASELYYWSEGHSMTVTTSD